MKWREVSLVIVIGAKLFSVYLWYNVLEVCDEDTKEVSDFKEEERE